MSHLGNGGAVRTSVSYGSTKKLSRQEKDQAIITCGMCGFMGVAKGNYYFVKTRSWDKKTQRYYATEFYNRRCITCANKTSREYSRKNRKYHAEVVAKAWRRNHTDSTDIRFLELQKDYSYRPRVHTRLESERLTERSDRKLAPKPQSKSNNKEDV